MVVTGCPPVILNASHIGPHSHQHRKPHEHVGQYRTRIKIRLAFNFYKLVFAAVQVELDAVRLLTVERRFSQSFTDGRVDTSSAARLISSRAIPSNQQRTACCSDQINVIQFNGKLSYLLTSIINKVSVNYVI